MVLTRVLEVWYNRKFIPNHEIVILLTFASIYSNRDSWYNAFIRQLYRNGAIHMKKFLVPVRYSAMINRLPIPYSAWCHVEIESESIDKLIDDVRHNRIDVELPPVDALSYIDDDVEIDHDKSIIDLDSGEEFYL